ncbi:MAG: RloB family protein [Desulfotalea sp.]
MRQSRADKKKNIARREKKRELYPTVLIVCEGLTEVKYLKSIKNKYKLNTANVEIVQGENSSPDQVYKHAIKAYKNYLKNKNASDCEFVFCVIDRDRHAHYLDTLHKIETIPLKKDHKIYAVNSVPSFEVWLWLHIKNSSKNFYEGGDKSPADLVIKEIKKTFPDWHKTNFDSYKATINDIEKASQRAQRLRNNNFGKDDCTYTKVDCLCEFLKILKTLNICKEKKIEKLAAIWG